MARERLTEPSVDEPSLNGGDSSENGIVELSARTPAIAAIPSLAVAAMLLLATWWDGGFDVRQWAPAAILALGALAAWVAIGPGTRRVGLAAASLVAIWAFAGWTLLTALWADSPAI